MEPDLPEGRANLTAVVRAAGDTIDIATAALVLGQGRTQATKTLSRWVAQGWLRRVGAGLYVPATLDSLDSARVLDDPWVLVPALFDPAYIGGRTAAEHWDLTEQIFRDIVVLTTRRIRQRSQERHGALFTLKHIKPDRIFGTKPVFRGRTKVAVSDVHRTLVDMLDDPALGGGIHQVSDCLRSYLRRSDRDDAKVIAYAERIGNRAIFKRLGFLAEGIEGGERLAAESAARLSAGIAKLDPALDGTGLVTRWGLWVPKTWKEGST